jgi:hypothetical protein
MTIVCQGCRKQIELPDLPQPQIMNLPGASILIVEHSAQTMCPNCLQPVVPAIAGANLALIGTLVPSKQQQSVILAPNGLKVM